jgi:FkbM family methyltransferase
MVDISSKIDTKHFGTKHRYPVMGEIADRVRGRALRFSRASQNGLWMACLPGDAVSNKVTAEGLYEKQFLYTLLPTLLDNKDVLRNTCMLDVGANIGNHTCFLAKYFGKVLAFEPNPAVFHILAANVYINNLQNVEPVQLGLGAEEAVLPFLQDTQGNLGSSTFSTNGDVHGIKRMLRVVRGDDYLRHNPPGMPIGFVKIDVEGFETQVLRGMSEILSQDYPMVLFENRYLGPDGPVAILKELGYSRFFGFHEDYFRFSNKHVQRLWKIIRNEIEIREASDPSRYHDLLALR